MGRSIKQIDEVKSSHQNTESSITNKFLNGLKDYLNHVKMFTKNARLYLLGVFLIGINFHVFQLLLNLYLKELGFAEGQIGYIISSKAIGSTIIAIPVVLLLGRIKLKPFLLIGCILFGLFSYFIASSQTMILLILFSILSGMAFAIFRVAAGPFYMRNSTRKERTHLFSCAFGTIILSGMAGSITSGKAVTILNEFTSDIILSYQYTLFGAILIGMTAIIPFLKIKATDPSTEENKIRLTLSQLKRRGGFYFKITICNFLIGMGAGLIIPFLNLYFHDRFNLEADTIGLFYFVVAFSMVAGSLSGPIIAKRLGLVRTVVITQLISIPFMFILSYSYILPLAFMAFVIRAGLMNLGIPIVSNLSMELSDKTEHGLVNALMMIAWTSSWMISAAAGGRMIEQFGYTTTINTTIIIYIISSLIFYILFKNAEKKTESSPGWTLLHEEQE